MITEVRRDRWGIPHLQAPDVLALARLQGRLTAEDRAWQIELDRWRMQGRTAERLGETGLAWDVFARQVRLEETARRAYEGLGAQTRAWVDAFVEGVDAGLPAAAAGSAELQRLGATGVRAWEPWTPLGIFWVAHVLFASFPTKLWRATVAERLGPEAVDLFGVEGETGNGSNAVAVAGAHTASGRPVVAGDPHRLLELPGVYAQVHLRCPELDVHGFTFPGVPGVQHFAHAGPVAWGITNAMADYQDLYLERLRRDGDRWQAQGPDGWEDVDVRTETIPVRTQPAPDAQPGADARPDPSALSLSKRRPGTAEGGRPEPVEEGDHRSHGAGRAESGAPSPTTDVDVTCLRTPRGPVVTGLEPPELGVRGAPTHALRVPSQVLDDLGFEALLPLLRARSVGDVESALGHWVEPVNSVLVADADGARHLLAGRVPDRAWRLTRLPGRGWDPADAWHGWREMPSRAVVDWEVNANDRASGGGLGPEYAPPHRARRLAVLVEASRPVTVETATAWTVDDRQGSLDVARPFLVSAVVDGAADDLRRRLLDWDGRSGVDSEPAAAFAAWRTALVHWLAGQPALAPLHDPAGHSALFHRWLDVRARVGLAWETLLGSGDRLGIDVAAGVAVALEVAEGTSGAAPSGGGTSGVWGERHRLVPLHGLDDPGTPEVGLAGDTGCVLATSSVPGVTDRCSRGPVARYVWDLADRRGSGWVVPFGAAGDPSSPHHHDQLPLWGRGQLVPLTEWDDLPTRENRR